MFEIGGIYSTDDGKGRFRIIKLLASADGIIHVRLYKQTFLTRPTTVDVANLSLGRPGDVDGFGMCHLPLRESAFIQRNPILVAQSPVTPDELDGYEIWKESGGGAF
jgi:hypothetical protein